MAFFRPGFRKAQKDTRTQPAVRRLRATMAGVVRPIYMGAPSLAVSAAVASRRSSLLYASRSFVSASRVAASPSRGQSGPSDHAMFRLEAGGASVPHPEKLDKGGEDAMFVAKDGGAMGVFDGVGAWSEMGVDPGIYARSLAVECNSAYEQLGPDSPHDLMDRAWINSQHITGSSTACCITLTKNLLRAANLGDSGFLVVRNGQLLHRQEEQTHGFNFPYQLGTNSRDGPKDADLVEIAVEPGDVVVAATDGVLDNIFTDDLVDIVREGLELGKNHSEIAERIAYIASLKANSPTEKTPFSVAATSAGYIYQGGKLDDITVVVGIVTSVTKAKL